MAFRIFTAILFFVSTAASSSESPARVFPSGYAGVRFGETVDDASSNYGAKLLPSDWVSEEEDEPGCYYVAPGGVFEPFSFMVEDGRIVRVDVDGPGILTEKGIGVGSTEGEVLAAYPDRVVISPHFYTGPEGHYCTVKFEGGFEIIFETDGVRVTRYRAGNLPTVRYVEGCL